MDGKAALVPLEDSTKAVDHFEYQAMGGSVMYAILGTHPNLV